MDYYSRGRGELTHRRVTPISLEAETYLHGYCHLRRDERVFRISRIADLRPVGGWESGTPVTEPKGPDPPAARPDDEREADDETTENSDGDGADDDRQMSLLGD